MLLHVIALVGCSVTGLGLLTDKDKLSAMCQTSTHLSLTIYYMTSFNKTCELAFAEIRYIDNLYLL